MQRKIILLDWGYFIFSSITFKSRMLQTKNKLEKEGKYEKAKKIFIMPSPYTALMKLFSNLKKIGVDADNDIVILAVDGRRSWRKEQEKEYKGNRKSLREKVPFINWDKEFELQNELLDKINISLPFFIIKIEHLEADDIIATAVKYFKDDLCIVIATDHDYDQLLIYDNVRIFVPLAKRKGSPYIPYRILNLDREKEKKLAFKSLSKKINKETPDNLNDELLTEKDFDTRLNIISLLDLPDFVTVQVKEKLDIINEFSDKSFNLECLPYKNMRKNYFEIFKPDKIISYDLCRKRLEKKLNKQKKRR